MTDRTIERTHELMRDVAGEARSTLHAVATAATPVGRTGTLRESWLALPIKHEGDRYRTGVQSDHWLMPMIAYGTMPHEVRPRGRAAGGKRALPEALGPRANAHVRGIAPHFPAEKAIDVVSQTIRETTTVARERWKRDCEFAIARDKRERLRRPGARA